MSEGPATVAHYNEKQDLYYLEVPSPKTEEEQLRLKTIADRVPLDTAAELKFDRIVQAAALATNSPIALVSMVLDNRQWFKARYGLNATETSRDVSFCAHNLSTDPNSLLIVPDAQMDARFAGNPLVHDYPNIRFYGGAAISVEEQPAGALCVIDNVPRLLSEKQKEILSKLAEEVNAVMRGEEVENPLSEQLLAISGFKPDFVETPEQFPALAAQPRRIAEPSFGERGLELPQGWSDVENCIGHGNTNVVYKVKIGDEFVAIKTLKTVSMVDPNEQESFLREVQVLLSFPPHPNCIKFIGALDVPPCVAMELVPRGSLQSYLRGGAKLNLAQQCQILIGTAKGMMHLAAHSVCHRDLSARNILLREDLSAVIADFGLSLVAPPPGQLALGIGPVRWMAPEALDKGEVTSAGDVWSYGVLLWELTHQGRQPYSGLTLVQVLDRVVHDNLVPDTADQPPQFAHLLSSCCRYDPSTRPSFATILQYLEANPAQDSTFGTPQALGVSQLGLSRHQAPSPSSPPTPPSNPTQPPLPSPGTARSRELSTSGRPLWSPRRTRWPPDPPDSPTASRSPRSIVALEARRSQPDSSDSKSSAPETSGTSDSSGDDDDTDFGIGPSTASTAVLNEYMITSAPKSVLRRKTPTVTVSPKPPKLTVSSPSTHATSNEWPPGDQSPSSSSSNAALVAYLTAHGFPTYDATFTANIFERERISPDLFVLMTESDLALMQLPIGIRLRLIRAFSLRKDRT